MAERPLISVVVEGYNESRKLGAVEETLESLKHQAFPLDRVEIVLVGRAEQIALWKQRGLDRGPFAATTFVETDGAVYFALKNLGARHASGRIIALTDSDIHLPPGWLAAIARGIEGGADVVVGPSLFRNGSSWNGHAATRLAAASITWGWIVGKNANGGPPPPAGFMDHNVAFRAETFLAHPYRTDLGRTCGAPLLFMELSRAGKRIALQPEQKVVHSFSWGYWLVKLHFRYGYEVHSLRRLDRDYPNQWIARAGWFEPFVTMAWHVLLDVPRWFRVGAVTGVGRARRLALFPLLVALSVVARASEMAGMLCTLAAPRAMRRWAESV